MALPDPIRMREIVDRLASFPTRNTLAPGNRESAAFLAGELRSVPGVRVETMEYVLPEGRRVPKPTPAVQVLGVLPGETDRRIMLSAHFDTLNLTGDPTDARAPGANDDASGVAVVLECARLLAAERHRHTFVFALLSGEEQGLLGARALAARCRDEGWKIEAVLNHDMVGNVENHTGRRDDRQVRVFSEESDSHASREFARWMEWTCRQAGLPVALKLVLRHDRFGRGGDHTPFNQAGFTAVRLTEAVEEYRRQHTADDLPEAMDFSYLAGVAAGTLACAQALGNAGEPVQDVRVERFEGHRTKVAWAGPAAATVYWRDTASSHWEASAAIENGAVVEPNIDDHVFAVGTGGIPVVASG